MSVPTWLKAAARWVVGAVVMFPAVAWLWGALKQERHRRERAEQAAIIHARRAKSAEVRARGLEAVAQERQDRLDALMARWQERQRQLLEVRSELDGLDLEDAWDRVFGGDG